MDLTPRRRRAAKIRVGVVGTTDGIAHFRAWGRKLKSVVQVPPPGKGEKADRLHLGHFPGLEEAFGISFEPDECSALSISAQGHRSRNPHHQPQRGRRQGRASVHRSRQAASAQRRAIGRRLDSGAAGDRLRAMQASVEANGPADGKRGVHQAAEGEGEHPAARRHGRGRSDRGGDFRGRS